MKGPKQGDSVRGGSNRQHPRKLSKNPRKTYVLVSSLHGWGRELEATLEAKTRHTEWHYYI